MPAVVRSSVRSRVARPHDLPAVLALVRQHRAEAHAEGLLAAAALYAEEVGADHLVATVGGHEAERQRFLSRMGFAPLTTRRIVPRELLVRSLSGWQANRLLPAPRRPVLRRPPVVRRPV